MMAAPTVSEESELLSETQDVIVLVVRHATDPGDLRSQIRTLVTALPYVGTVGVLDFTDDERVVVRDGRAEMRPVLK
jgi:hypothetical protein